MIEYIQQNKEMYRINAINKNLLNSAQVVSLKTNKIKTVYSNRKG